MKLTKTKVLATIGPACSSLEILEKMVLEGMNLCRLNFSHGDFNSHRKISRDATRNTGAEYDDLFNCVFIVISLG